MARGLDDETAGDDDEAMRVKQLQRYVVLLKAQTKEDMQIYVERLVAVGNVSEARQRSVAVTTFQVENGFLTNCLE